MEGWQTADGRVFGVGVVLSSMHDARLPTPAARVLSSRFRPHKGRLMGQECVGGGDGGVGRANVCFGPVLYTAHSELCSSARAMSVPSPTNLTLFGEHDFERGILMTISTSALRVPSLAAGLGARSNQRACPALSCPTLPCPASCLAVVYRLSGRFWRSALVGPLSCRSCRNEGGIRPLFGSVRFGRP